VDWLMAAEARDNRRLSGTRVLVTGGTGKLGRQLVTALHGAGALVAVLTRSPNVAGGLWQHTDIACILGDLTEPDSLRQALEGVELVFHLASYSPRLDEPDLYEAPSHWPVTAVGTRDLLDAAVAAGVSGLIYLSSVKAMGEGAGADGRPADEATPARPETLYGRAKLEAEQAVLQAGFSNGLHVCVLRLPMVYGLGAGGNLYRMIDAVARGRFPPWPQLVNRRSAVHVDDLVSAALLVATDPRAAGETYLVTDGVEYSTRWIYEQIRLALGWPIPTWTLPFCCWRLAARVGTLGERLTGRPMPLNTTALSKLAGDAWYSSRKIRDTLSFTSRHHLGTEIPSMVRAYRQGLERPASG
jgi:nucleoside-diphosphate-sugar epimerase